MKPSLILSANAVPKRGGQGLNLQHMIEALGGPFDLSLFSAGAVPEAPTQIVPPSPVSQWLGKIPVLRRFRDWQTAVAEKHFDQYVAARLRPAKLFQGTTGQCLASLTRARALGCRTALDVVTTHIEDLAEQMTRECAHFGIRAPLHAGQQARIRREYEQAEVIRVMSRVAQRTFLERGFSAGRVVVATPPMNCDEFPEAQFDGPKFRVSFVGLLEPWKGFHYLIDAFQRAGIRDSELILWGGSGSRPVSRYLLEQLGRTPALQTRGGEVRKIGLGEVYGKSSVLVHPSLTDGFGYVVAEAMASGIPVIVTQNTGAADLIVDGENGYVVPPRDVEALRERLVFLAANPARLRAMGRAARLTARGLTGAAFMREYEPALRRLLA